eukprot:ctg_393.g207
MRPPPPPSSAEHKIADRNTAHSRNVEFVSRCLTEHSSPTGTSRCPSPRTARSGTAPALAIRARHPMPRSRRSDTREARRVTHRRVAYGRQVERSQVWSWTPVVQRAEASAHVDASGGGGGGGAGGLLAHRVSPATETAVAAAHV